jgi:Uma2 family endonuclease
METTYPDFIEEFQTEDIMSLNHSRLSYRISIQLSKYDEQFDILPELEFELAVDKAKPDISICEKMDIDWLHDTVRLKKPPITAIEILSPKQAYHDLTDKIYDNYFKSGVKSAWLIIPSVKAFQLFLPNQTVKYFTDTIFQDPTTAIELDLSLIFKF